MRVSHRNLPKNFFFYLVIYYTIVGAFLRYIFYSDYVSKFASYFGLIGDYELLLNIFVAAVVLFVALAINLLVVWMARKKTR